MIKTIIFDLGGVLFISDGGTYEARERLATELNIDVKKLHDIWFTHKEKLLKGLMKEEDYLQEVIYTFNLDLSMDNLKEIIRSYNKINPRILSLVTNLKNNYNLFALTNELKEWHEYRLNNFHLNNYFTKIICSAGVGLIKPEKEIYELCLKLTKSSPNECVFIDDRIENLKFPQELGMHVIHFKDSLNLLEELKKLNISVQS